MTNLFLVDVVQEVDDQDFHAMDGGVNIPALLVTEVDESCVEGGIDTWGMWHLAGILCCLIDRGPVDALKKRDLWRAQRLFIDAGLHTAEEASFLLLIPVVAKVIRGIYRDLFWPCVGTVDMEGIELIRDLYMILLSQGFVEISEEFHFFGGTLQIIGVKKSLNHMNEVIELELRVSDQELIYSLNGVIHSRGLLTVDLIIHLLASGHDLRNAIRQVHHILGKVDLGTFLSYKLLQDDLRHFGSVSID